MGLDINLLCFLEGYKFINTIFIQKHPHFYYRLVPDRAQAGGSINDGEIEMMLNRRMNIDDDRGVDEPLDELGKIVCNY